MVKSFPVFDCESHIVDPPEIWDEYVQERFARCENPVPLPHRHRSAVYQRARCARGARAVERGRSRLAAGSGPGRRFVALSCRWPPGWPASGLGAPGRGWPDTVRTPRSSASRASASCRAAASPGLAGSPGTQAWPVGSPGTSQGGRGSHPPRGSRRTRCGQPPRTGSRGPSPARIRRNRGRITSRSPRIR